ncbi:MAG: cysteine desulfurase [Bacteroidota bacterium]
MEANTAQQIDIQTIRKHFPLLEREMNGKPLVFLDSAASSQKPDVVLEALEHYYEHQHANVHRGVYGLSQEATEAFELGREKAREFLNAASTEEIIFTKGATESMNLVASSFGRQFLKEGDEVVISTMEHHSNIVPWQIICEQTGAKLKVIPINEEGELLIEEYEKLLSDKTKIVAVVHVSNALGTINPVEEIIEKAHERDIPVLVDGAQATPHLKIDVQALDVDFYAFSAHKVYGPTGMGVLYGKKKWLEAIPPYQGGGEMIATVSFEKTTYNELPYKFEAGTPNIAGSVALGVALDFVKEIGQENIAAHEAELLAYATEQLSKIEGLRIIGQARNKASVISFLVEGVHPYDLGTILDKQGIAVRTGHHCTQPLMDRFSIPGTVRASFGVYNTKEEVDKLVAGVERAVSILK